MLSLTDGQPYNPEKVPPFLQNLQSQNDFVISYRLKYSESSKELSDYFVLLGKGMNFKAYNYSTGSETLDQLNLSNEMMQLIWDTFIQNELFSLRNENEISVFCPEKYRIYNSYSYEFVFLSKGEVKVLSYYNPEYYDNWCYGMTERKKIINSVAVINYVLSQ